MASITQLQSIRAIALRATLLDDCGRPVNVQQTNKTQISTDGFISIGFSHDIEEGEKVRKKLGNGKLCLVDNGVCPQPVGVEITLTLCAVPPHLMELLTGTPQLLDDNGNVIGLAHGGKVDNCSPHVMIEVWTDNAGKKCDENGRVCKYIRYILTNTFNWMISGDITLENDAYDFELKGYGEVNDYFNSPLGAADPDLNAANIEAIRGQMWAMFCSEGIPDEDIISDNWVNP